MYAQMDGSCVESVQDQVRSTSEVVCGALPEAARTYAEEPT